MMINEHIVIRPARESDITLIINFIRELAEYEHLTHLVEVNEKNLKEYIFEKKMAEVIIAEYNHEPAGFALYFYNFSTFLGKPGIYLEDLFVNPTFRGKGLGKHILSHLAKIVREQNYGRLEWACLNWNEPSIKFYQSQGAQSLDEWMLFRVSGKALEVLALS